MITDNIIKINNIYKNYSEYKIIDVNVKLDIFKSVLAKFHECEKRLKGTDDAYWDSFFKFFKFYRYEFALSLLPFAHPCLFNFPAYQKLKIELKNCHDVYPSLFPIVHSILQEFEEIQREGIFPLLEILAQLYSNVSEKKVLILLQNTNFIRPVQECLADSGLKLDVAVGACSFVDEHEASDEIILIGAAKWYPQHIFNSPRSKIIKLLRLDWIVDVLPQFEYFSDLKSSQSCFDVVQEAQMIQVCSPVQVEDVKYDAEAIIPVINWDVIKAGLSVQPQDGGEELRDCYLCLLENGGAVYVDGDPDAKLLVLDFYELDKIRTVSNSNKDDIDVFVKRIKTSDIKKEMFVLLRTKGSGDYIDTVAQRLLGAKAEEVIELQAEWKRQLKEQVVKTSTFDVSYKLLEAGSKIAEEYNVRNWMSEHSIRPRSDDDFMAILKYLNLSDAATKYFEAARLMNKAHLRAGFYIRKQLIKKTKQISVHEFEKETDVVIDLPGLEAGTLTAFKVRDISKEKFRVSGNKINQVIQNA